LEIFASSKRNFCIIIKQRGYPKLLMDTLFDIFILLEHTPKALRCEESLARCGALA
jgi:hypothetical protein